MRSVIRLLKYYGLAVAVVIFFGLFVALMMSMVCKCNHPKKTPQHVTVDPGCVR